MQIRLVQKEDWEEVWVDDKLKMEGHSLRSRDWLKMIDELILAEVEYASQIKNKKWKT